MQFYVYVLQSRKDLKLYVGITNDVKQRFLRHNEGRVKSTKNRAPFSLVHQEIFTDRKTARSREKFLKSGNGRKVLEKVLARVVELADTPA